ncbi:hypothetical protein AB5I41_19510 [Sphingomonas sp. MMS24-JH45]
MSCHDPAPARYPGRRWPRLRSRRRLSRRGAPRSGRGGAQRTRGFAGRRRAARGRASASRSRGRRNGEAAAAFADAARASELASDERAADYWAQSGNAWLAAGDPAKARGALDAALAAGTLTGLDRGEAYLDRARALVAAGNPPPRAPT